MIRSDCLGDFFFRFFSALLSLPSEGSMQISGGFAPKRLHGGSSQIDCTPISLHTSTAKCLEYTIQEREQHIVFS